ncbi:MAG TPA: hypothetical protein VHX39_36740, partial [Acetobacteraceae bacterium]|nr:hypothetical protein [Acetobacteraceae bacterium]
MEPNHLTLGQDEFNAHMLRGVMDATGQPGETAQYAQMRCATIVEIFRTFEAANPMESMIACHCISLHFLLESALRDANAPNLRLELSMRLRASVMAIRKSLHLCMADFASLHARNKARATEVLQRANQPDTVATPAKPQPAAVQQPVARPEQPRPVAAKPTLPVAPLAGLDALVRSALRLP